MLTSSVIAHTDQSRERGRVRQLQLFMKHGGGCDSMKPSPGAYAGACRRRARNDADEPGLSQRTPRPPKIDRSSKLTFLIRPATLGIMDYPFCDGLCSRTKIGPLFGLAGYTVPRCLAGDQRFETPGWHVCPRFEPEPAPVPFKGSRHVLAGSPSSPGRPLSAPICCII